MPHLAGPSQEPLPPFSWIPTVLLWSLCQITLLAALFGRGVISLSTCGNVASSQVDRGGQKTLLTASFGQAPAEKNGDISLEILLGDKNSRTVWIGPAVWGTYVEGSPLRQEKA